MKENEKKEDVIVAEEELANFTWDSTESLEFFGTEKEEDETKLTEEEKKKIKESVKKDEPEKPEKPEDDDEPEKTEEELEAEKKVKEKDDEATKFFEEEPEKEEPEKEELTDEFFVTLAKGLKDKGVLTNVEIPDELTEEDFVSLYEEEIDTRIDETFDSFFEELDEDGKAFLKFKKEGGDTREFFEMLGTTSTYPTGDIEDEDTQRKVLEYYYKHVENLDDDDIEERIEWLEEKGKLEKYAEKYNNKLQTIEQKQKQLLLDKQAEQKRKNKERAEKFEKELQTVLEENDTIKNFSIPKKEKKSLLTFITKPTVKTGKNSYITPLQKGLQEISKDYEKLVILAKLIKNNFDISDVVTKQETKKVRELKSSLQRAKKNVKPKTSGGQGKKSLSDYF